ncbi:MAG: ArsR family transcriptional regulator [Archangium sp.]
MTAREPLPPPSPLTLPNTAFPKAPPPFVIKAAMKLRSLLQRAADLVVPAEIAAFDRTWGAAITVMVGAVARYRIVDALGDESLTAAEIAAKTKTNPDAVHRTLRALATQGMFAVDSAGRFTNTRLSRGLMGGRPSRVPEFITYFTSSSNLAAWSDFNRSLEDGEAAFDRVHGKTVWDWFDEHPDEREMFAHGMMGITVGDAPFVADLYPFQEITKLCDVGGGRGTLISELLLRFPHLKGVLCDAPGVIESAKKLLTERGVIERCELVPGSFFDFVPGGCDAYSIKNVLHDWDDARCVKILSTVRKAMTPGTRLLLMEILTEPNDGTGFGPLLDMHMLVACSGGRERGVEQLRQLLEKSGFKLERVFPGPTCSILDARAS